MLHENPLEIPEITGLVASYLEENDLASCVQVSKKWRDILLPHRWRVISAGSKPSNHSTGLQDRSRCRFGPHASDIYRHRHLIHVLSLIGDTAGLENYNYPILRKLTVDYRIGAEDSEREVFLELTEMFPSLARLALRGITLTPPSWLALSAHPRITSLSMEVLQIKITDIPIFWEVCKKLERLVLRTVAIDDGTIPAGAVFDRLHTLSLAACDIGVLGIRDQLQLILRCPNLEGLHLYDYSENIDEDTESIPRECWPHLKRMYVNARLRDTSVASILEGAGTGSGKFSHLTLQRCDLEEQGSMALSRHFSTLVELDLQGCLSDLSSTFRDILCSCSRLETLYATDILGRDIVAGGPWVCQQLQALKICFRFGESEEDLQQEVFERLSTLTRLRRLEMYLPEHGSYEEEYSLEFRLEYGMGRLATLQQLTLLSFEETDNRTYLPHVGREEALWILANWKEQTSIRGRLDEDPDEDHALKEALRFFGADVE